MYVNYSLTHQKLCYSIYIRSSVRIVRMKIGYFICRKWLLFFFFSSRMRMRQSAVEVVSHSEATVLQRKGLEIENSLQNDIDLSPSSSFSSSFSPFAVRLTFVCLFGCASVRMLTHLGFYFSSCWFGHSPVS